MGGALLQGMMKLREEFEVVGDVRGKGLMLGMDFVTNKVILAGKYSKFHFSSNIAFCV